jgi:predicted metal-dependent hydrolase
MQQDPHTDVPIRFVASQRRQRTVSARMVGGVLEVRVPAWMPFTERERWAQRLRDRIERRRTRAQPIDARLQERAELLNRRYYAGRLRWASVSFAEQERRWGSCSVPAATIRISSRAAALPQWVLDYLIVHELAHLEVAGHGPRFWELVNRYPLTERARGYLMALDHRGGEPDEDPAAECGPAPDG